MSESLLSHQHGSKERSLLGFDSTLTSRPGQRRVAPKATRAPKKVQKTCGEQHAMNPWLRILRMFYELQISIHPIPKLVQLGHLRRCQANLTFKDPASATSPGGSGGPDLPESLCPIRTFPTIYIYLEEVCLFKFSVHKYLVCEYEFPRQGTLGEKNSKKQVSN